MRITRLAKQKEIEEQEEVDLSLLDDLIKKYKGKKGNMIPLLQGAQNAYRYLPEVALKKLSAETGHKLSDMYGVATFYAQFRLKPVGKHVIKELGGMSPSLKNITMRMDGIGMFRHTLENMVVKQYAH